MLRVGASAVVDRGAVLYTPSSAPRPITSSVAIDSVINVFILRSKRKKETTTTSRPYYREDIIAIKISLQRCAGFVPGGVPLVTLCSCVP